MIFILTRGRNEAADRSISDAIAIQIARRKNSHPEVLLTVGDIELVKHCIGRSTNKRNLPTVWMKWLRNCDVRHAVTIDIIDVRTK